MKKIVLTGAPHSGKTTLIEALLSKGYLVIPESAIQVIDSVNDLLGPKGALRWRRHRFEAFQSLISERQFYLEKSVEESLDGTQSGWHDMVFMDRGAHDGLAFARHFNKVFPTEAMEYVEQADYDHVFLLNLILPFNARGSTGRLETVEDCLAIESHLNDVYTEVGLEPTVVPMMSVDDRVEFILEQLDPHPVMPF